MRALATLPAAAGSHPSPGMRPLVSLCLMRLKSASGSRRTFAAAMLKGPRRAAPPRRRGGGRRLSSVEARRHCRRYGPSPASSSTKRDPPTAHSSRLRTAGRRCGPESIRAPDQFDPTSDREVEPRRAQFPSILCLSSSFGGAVRPGPLACPGSTAQVSGASALRDCTNSSQAPWAGHR